MESANTFIYLILAVLAVAFLWGAAELHLLRHRVDATADRARRRQKLSPQLFDQEATK